MSSPCALWHRNILELKPVALLRPPPALDTIIAMKLKKFEVSGSSRSYGGYQRQRCFKPGLNFYPYLWNHLSHFSSKTPNA